MERMEDKAGMNEAVRNISSVLCNYMKDFNSLKRAITNRALVPRYEIEFLDYLNISGLEKIAFPMTSFCDIPKSHVPYYRSRHGEYGIIFDKWLVYKKFQVQPVHYINQDSLLAEDFREMFEKYYFGAPNCVSDKDWDFLNYILSSLAYMKPIFNTREEYGMMPGSYVYADECEWRFLPVDRFSKDLAPFLNQKQSVPRICDAYSKVLEQNHPETWLHFDWKDIYAIVLPSESARRGTFEVIRQLPLNEFEKDILISKCKVF